MMPLEKVIQFNTKKPPVDVPSDSNNDKIEVDNSQEEINMSQENYSKNEIDLKFDNLEQKINSKFDNLSQKIDDGFEKQTLRMENLLLRFKDDLNTEQRENKKWLIGISIGSALTFIGIIVSIITLFLQQK
ncbi:hypothetical protein [Streptococcus parauberis]|uniref:hypothetical protein n=1 Tax=Streptococcus parauberis TaxID=1348 RepID=UPI0039AF10FF